MTRTILTILLTTTLIASPGQVLEKFEFSDCMTECIGDSTTIDMFTQKNGVTEIYLTAYANCSGNLKGQIKITNDSLNLIYSPKVTRIKNKKTGEVEEFIEVAMCDCIFKFSYTIIGLDKLDIKKIKINGETLTEINKRERRELSFLKEEVAEITFDFDTTWSPNKIYIITEKTAYFPGGMEKFKEYITNNQILPKKEISGKVFVEFVINADGSIDDSTITVIRGLNDECDKEALRLMQECPDWIPGTIKGKPVKQKFVLPIAFASLKTNRK